MASSVALPKTLTVKSFEVNTVPPSGLAPATSHRSRAAASTASARRTARLARRRAFELTRRCAGPVPARRPWLGPPQPSVPRAPAASACSDSAEGGLASGGAVCEAWRARRRRQERAREQDKCQDAGRRQALGAIGAHGSSAPTPALSYPLRTQRATAPPTRAQNDGCSIHEGLAVKRALLFAGQPLLPWLGPSNPSARSA